MAAIKFIIDDGLCPPAVQLSNFHVMMLLQAFELVLCCSPTIAGLPKGESACCTHDVHALQCLKGYRYAQQDICCVT
jgi:hypothetical protein